MTDDRGMVAASGRDGSDPSDHPVIALIASVATERIDAGPRAAPVGSFERRFWASQTLPLHRPRPEVVADR